MGRAYGTPTRSGGDKNWYVYCDYPDSGNGTAYLKLVLGISGASYGHMYTNVSGSIDGTSVGTVYDTYLYVPDEYDFSNGVSVGPGTHTFSATFSGSGYSGINGTCSGSFTVATPVSKPSYTSTSSSDVTSSSVKLTASINNGGATITAGGWQLSTDGGSTWTTYSGNWGSKTITGLSRNTTYTYRGYATNSAGTTYSSTNTFTTLKEIPVISTPVVSNITSNSAYISYTITDAGGGTVSSNVIKVYDVNQDILVATINSNAGTATGLSPNTLYAADGQATNEAGTSMIKSATFTTLAAQGLPVSVNGGAFSNKTIYLSVNGGSFNNIGANIKTSVNGGSF